MKLCRPFTAMTLLLSIFFACSCQASVPLPAANISPALAVTTTRPAAPAFTATHTAIAIPTRTSEPSATPRPQLAATATTAPLAPGGPWLLYRRIVQSPVGGFWEELFVSNQDGSGSRIINRQDCESSAPVSIIAHPTNRMVALHQMLVLVNLEGAVSQYVSPHCKTKFSGSAESGLLATIDRNVTELRIYELPQGKLRSAFPISPCSDPGQKCGFDDSYGEWTAQWDPSTRYLVFPVLVDGARSHLYLYDAQAGVVRLLSIIPGWVSVIWWSPGGTNIVLGVSPDGGFSLDSFWVTTPLSGEAHRLTKAEGYLGDVDLLDWLDENRFLYYRGSLQHVVTVGAHDLRMLDLRTAQVTTLFGDGFLRAGLDRQAGVIGVVAAVYNSQYEDGVYLVPAANPIPQKIAPIETEGIYNTFWVEDLRLFVTGDRCEDGSPGFRAFDSSGRWRCAPSPWPEETSQPVDYPSPDGQWRAIAEEGLWVERSGKPPVQVHETTPTQVIWRPDAGGFFFIASWGLYYAALPDLAVQPLDQPGGLGNGLVWGSDQLEYKWIGSGGQ